VRFVLEEAGVGWVPFLYSRFDREYDFGGTESLNQLVFTAALATIPPPSFGVPRRGLYGDVVRRADLLDRSRRCRHCGVQGGHKLPISR
jgi:hypothetical protein